MSPDTTLVSAADGLSKSRERCVSFSDKVHSHWKPGGKDTMYFLCVSWDFSMCFSMLKCVFLVMSSLLFMMKDGGSVFLGLFRCVSSLSTTMCVFL